MVSKVSNQMLESKVVLSASMSGNIITFGFSDNTNMAIDVSSMPIFATVTSMLSQLKAINDYIAANP